MDKHCKGCTHHHSAGRRNPEAGLGKYNDWCCKRGAPVNIGWCKTHNAKTIAGVNAPDGEQR